MENILNSLKTLAMESGIARFIAEPLTLVMVAIASLTDRCI